jgi:pyrroline-5-carboxylate reductase
MESVQSTVCVIGMGNLGRAVAARLIAGGWPTDRIMGAVRHATDAQATSESSGIAVYASTSPRIFDADVLVLTVRPEDARAVLEHLAKSPRQYGASLVSFVVGLSCDVMASYLGAHHLYRVSSNVESVRRGGLLAVSQAETTPGRTESLSTERFLHAIGKPLAIPETQQDAAATILGSGAAFLAYVANDLASAGVAAGLSANDSDRFVSDALLSASSLIGTQEEGEVSMRSLATRGGITASGLSQLSAGQSRLREAVSAAMLRARELSIQFPDDSVNPGRPRA